MKIGLISLGCAKNLVNSEQMMYLLKEAGFNVSGDYDNADAVIINTCGFIESAKTEAIETILEMGAAKAEGKIGRLIVAGCLAQRYKNEILTEMPEIDAVVGTGSFDEIVEVIQTCGAEHCSLRHLPRNSMTQRTNVLHHIQYFNDIHAPVSETGRIISTSAHWAYLKIAEGCDNRCAYCCIPDIRGRFRSRPMENIVNEARELASRGYIELIIVAQDVTMYGLDLYGRRRLTDLLSELCEIDQLKWIRLHYLYPYEIDDELIDLIAKNDKILKYLDIPVQHINDGILQNMNRRGTSAGIRGLFRKIRERIPGVVIRTSVITGLPGEGEAEFEELCDFLREMKFERAGVFPYSPEEGTAAALMERPDAETAMHRASHIAELQSKIMDDYNKCRIGSITQILLEKPNLEFQYQYGRSYAESPDVDGYIIIKDTKNHTQALSINKNALVNIRITGIENGELVSVLI